MTSSSGGTIPNWLTLWKWRPLETEWWRCPPATGPRGGARGWGGRDGPGPSSTTRCAMAWSPERCGLEGRSGTAHWAWPCACEERESGRVIYRRGSCYHAVGDKGSEFQTEGELRKGDHEFMNLTIRRKKFPTWLAPNMLLRSSVYYFRELIFLR